jgi:DNA-binding XRE family transcriptional regulator
MTSKTSSLRILFIPVLKKCKIFLINNWIFAEVDTLGTAIKELRLSKNISQESLALSAEVDRRYLGRIERGDNNAAVLTLHRIARGLEISLTALFARSGL